MNEFEPLTRERIDDVPILLAQLERMQVANLLDRHPSRVRVDSTTVSGSVHPSPDGLFQFGHSKDHRPDLPQVKIKLSALDPLGLPVGVTLVGGQRADDGLYVPAIQQAQQTLGK